MLKNVHHVQNKMQQVNYFLYVNNLEIFWLILKTPAFFIINFFS